MAHKLPEDIGIAETFNNFNFVDTLNNFIKYAANGNLRMVHEFLKGGADIHAENDSALRRAATNGHLEVVCALLKYGANVRAENDHALRRAATNGHLEVVCALLKCGADVHALDDEALRLSAMSGEHNLPGLKKQIESAHENIEYITRIDFSIYENGEIGCDSSLGVPMDWDAPHKRPTPDDYLGIVTILLEYGANINAQDDYALRASVANSNIKIIEKLLEHGANIYANNAEILDNLQQDFNEEIAGVLLPYCNAQDYGYFPSTYIKARITPTKSAHSIKN